MLKKGFLYILFYLIIITPSNSYLHNHSSEDEFKTIDCTYLCFQIRPKSDELFPY